MNNENCAYCLFSSERPSLINGDEIWYKCCNENSPYYDEMVFETTSCRLFIDYENYIKLKDRKGAIDKLLNNKL